MSFIKKYDLYFLTLLSGVLLVLSFPPIDIAPLIWVALVPWLYALNRSKSKKEAFLLGLELCFVMSIGGFFWIAYAIQEFGQVPWILAIILMIIFACFNEIQFLVWGPFFYIIRKNTNFIQNHIAHTVILITGFSLIYAGMDWLLPKLFLDTLGHAFYKSSWLRQSVDFGGTYLLTFVVIFFNLSIWFFLHSFLENKNKLKVSVAPVLVSITLIAALLVYGALREKQIIEFINNPQKTVNAGVIQGNVGDIEKFAAESGLVKVANEIINKMIRLSEQALTLSNKPDFIIWPETTYPSAFLHPLTYSEKMRDIMLQEFVKSKGVPLLTGGYDSDGFKDFNTVFFLFPIKEKNGETNLDIKAYHKSVLLLFGEYIPYAEYFPFIKEIFPQIANFGRGPGPEVFRVPLINSAAKFTLVAPVICYEILLPYFTIGGANKGAEWILNVTNDSWFGPYSEPQMHLALSTFRSIETRLPQVRSTNTGITALILPDGRITKASKIGVPEIIDMQVPIIKPTPTLLKKWGDWFPPVALLLGLFIIGVLTTFFRKIASH